MVVPHGRADRRRSCVRSRSVTCPGGEQARPADRPPSRRPHDACPRCKRDSFTQPRYPLLMARQRSQANSPQLGLRPGREQSQWDCGRADNSPSGTAAWQTPVLGPPDIRVRIHYRGRFVKSSEHCGTKGASEILGQQHGHRASQGPRRRAAGGNDSRGRSADLSHPYAARIARRARVTSDVPDGWPTGGVEVSSRKAVSSSAQTPCSLSRRPHRQPTITHGPRGHPQ